MPMPKNVDPNRTLEVFDDFTFLDTGHWTAVNDGGTGTAAISATPGPGGWLDLPTAASDNDYHVLPTGKVFSFAAGKPLWLEARITCTEANTDDVNLFVGLSDVTDGALLTDNGGGPPTSYTGAGLFKVDGGTVWQAEVSNTTTQVTNTSFCPFTSGRTYRVGLHFDPRDGTTGRIYPWIYDETAGHLYATSYTSQDLSLPITDAKTAMAAVIGVKAGAGNAETVSIDYIRAIQAR